MERSVVIISSAAQRVNALGEQLEGSYLREASRGRGEAQLGWGEGSRNSW